MQRMLILGDSMIARDEIVGIFDLDTTTVSKHSRDFLRAAQNSGVITPVGDDLPQSFIVTGDVSGQKVYLSPQSTPILAKKLLTTP